MREILISDLLSLMINRDSQTSLQKQIYEIIKKNIINKSLLSRQKLPSSRSLATQLKVSRITVSLAYDRLIAEDYLTAKEGSGTFVTDSYNTLEKRDDTEINNVPKLALSQRGKRFFQDSGGSLNQHSGAFIPGIADVSTFPFHIWKRLIGKHIDKSQIALTGYPKDGAGFKPLREAIASYLNISRMVKCSAKQVMITNGTHQSIDLCARMLADHGDVAIIEDPCHWAFPSVLRASGIKVISGLSDQNGLKLDTTIISPNTKFVISSPSHQYPTGVIMPTSRRLELLDTAKKHNLWIIEDDYDSEFRYDVPPLPSLQGLSQGNNVIYMGTFSKSMFAGIRTSYMVVPEHLAESFSDVNAKLYRSGVLHIQAALADFILEGHLGQHIKQMRNIYAERHFVFRDSLNRELGSTLSLSQAKAGLHLYAGFTEKINMPKLFSDSKAENIILGRPYYVDNGIDHASNSIILGYGGVPTNQINNGVKKLVSIIDKCL